MGKESGYCFDYAIMDIRFERSGDNKKNNRVPKMVHDRFVINAVRGKDWIGLLFRFFYESRSKSEIYFGSNISSSSNGKKFPGIGNIKA